MWLTFLLISSWKAGDNMNNKNEPPHDKTNKVTVRPVIRVFAVRLMGS